MTNELHYGPGEEVPVEVLADSSDDVAREGEGVALVGENESVPTVELVESTSDRCIGLLASDPAELDDPDNSESDYTSGDNVGRATLHLAHHVFWMPVDSGYSSPSVGDYVEVGDGGDVEAYTGPTTTGQDGAVTNTLGVDGSGSLENNSASDIDIDFTNDAFPFGMVFTTVAREWGVQGKVAVMRGVF